MRFDRRSLGILASAALVNPARNLRGAIAAESSGNWRQIVAAASTPPPRWDHTLAADDHSKKLLLFGGRDQSGAALADLWQFARTDDTWTPIDGAGPEPRFGHAVATDQESRQMYLFGGQSADTFYNDLWQLDLASMAWQRIHDGAAPGPSPRYGTSLVLTTERQLIVSHGFTFEGRFDDTWGYNIDAGDWTNLTPDADLVRPLKRCLHEAVWSARANRMRLFGGCSSGFGPCPQGDHWSFEPGAGLWTELAIQDSPVARSNPALAYDEPRDQLLLVGGLTDAGYDSPLWALTAESTESPAWIQHELLPGPTPRASHDIVTTGPHLYLFGGNSDAGVLNDLWTLDVRELK